MNCDAITSLAALDYGTVCHHTWGSYLHAARVARDWRVRRFGRLSNQLNSGRHGRELRLTESRNPRGGDVRLAGRYSTLETGAPIATFS